MVKELFAKMFKGAEGDTFERQSKIVIHTKSLGSTGTENYAGYFSEDYLNEMRGTERARLFDKMRRQDSQVKMLLNATSSMLKGALWEIEPYDQTQDWAKQDAELVRYNLFEAMDKTWSQFLTEAFSFIPFGHSVFEPLHGVVFNHGVHGTINIVKSMPFRSQKTLENWYLDKEYGTDRLKSITQYSYGDIGKTINIPADVLLIFTNEQEGSNYEGVSALRCCYGNWFRKNLYMRLNAIGIEKFAVPTPVVEVPAGKESSPEFETLKECLEAYISHENAYLTIPFGWKLILNNSTYDPQKVEISIDNEDKRMTKAFLANFLELGMNGFGSQSLSLDLSDFFTGSIDQLAKNFSDKINQQLIPSIIQMNRPQRPGYPKLKHSGISDKAGKEFADVINGFVQQGVLSTDDVLESHVRKRFALPEAKNAGSGIIPGAVPGAENTELDVQKTALNGAQVEQLVNIVTQVAAGMIPRDSAVNVIATAFQLDVDSADKILGQAGNGFKIDPATLPQKHTNPFSTNQKLAEKLEVIKAKHRGKTGKK